MIPLLGYQKLTGYIDGTIAAPPATVGTNPNPAYTTWLAADQRALILLQSSLSEEAMAETFGHDTARAVWVALETTYSHDSVEKIHTLRDSIRHLQKGSSTVADYTRKFKAISDQLTAIGHPLEESEKIHWFLSGLGSAFETFSTTQRLIKPRSSFRDILSQAESHEMFLSTITNNNPSPVAFTASSGRGSSSQYRGRNSSRGGNTRGRGRGNLNRRPPHCQLCRKDEHYATQCPDLSTFDTRNSSPAANIAQAFHAQCNVSNNSPDWFVDTGASSHMTSSAADLDTASPYCESDFKGASSSGMK